MMHNKLNMNVNPIRQVGRMRFFLDFLKQKVPKPGKEIPSYYRRALLFSEFLLVVYFAVCFFFSGRDCAYHL